MADKSRNLVAAVSYLLGFITGVTILLVEKDDKIVRFHAMQSVLVFGGLFIVNLFINIFLGFASGLISSLISIASLIIWLVSMIKAYRGELFKWPVVGDLAEKQVGKA